jgi:hypothetical protein
LVAFGCGDASYALNPGHIEPVPSDQLLDCFEGAEAELTRFSTACGRTSEKTLETRVSDGPEFTSDMVASLDAPCSEGPSPGIEVLIERHSVVFDFGFVEAFGRFPEADFDGYIIDLNLSPENAFLIGATVDREHTTLAVEPDDIAFESDHIEVNFEGVSYEPGSMLEIKLWFANLPAVPEDV